MPYFTGSDSAQIYYEVEGNGSPVLLIHGFMGTGATEFPALRAWLAAHYQVIAPDLRGYGRSTPKPRPYGLDFYRQDAEDLAGLLAHLNLTGVGVLGYSDGGESALWLPILAPECIAGVLTWGATGHFNSDIRAGIMSILQMRWVTDEIRALHGAGYIQPMVKAWGAALLGMINAGGDVTFSRAGEIGCPVLMLLGEEDNLNPVAMAQAMAAAIPQGEFHLFAGGGHDLHEEQPAEFQRIAAHFLDQIAHNAKSTP